MRINIINDEKNFRFFFIEVCFPKIGRIKGINEWTDEFYDGFEMSFPTEICFLMDHRGYWHFSLTLLGFGAKIVNQNGY